MSQQIVEIPQELKDSLRKFRFARRNAGSAALVVKINKQALKMEEVEQFDSISIEELAEELPEASPRYIVLSYELKHDDGRTSFPLVLINWTPQGSETGLMTLHASSLIAFQNTVSAIGCGDARWPRRPHKGCYRCKASLLIYRNYIFGYLYCMCEFWIVSGDQFS
ncbi:hypothetical protein RSAG8_02024, partial [Rhizoctonia solani AG-8 WAC10335]